ncbi:MAG: transglutaminase family protein [Planctomycetes bacterium]|nr:transglutaminase family protein [Planctomycetota bacterium]
MAEGLPLKTRLVRASLRAAALAAGLLLLLFPHTGRLAREIAALTDPNALIAPDDPAVAALSVEVDAKMPAGLDGVHQVAWIEKFVQVRIAYAHDWTQWWNVDYWPTPSETVAAGREDCDGIAVLTASLLRRRGFKARLEGNIQHVWVAVEDQRILSPDEETNFDERGWSLPGLREIFEWLRYALVEFPFWRWCLLGIWTVAALRWPNARRTAGETIVCLALLAASAAAARSFPVLLFGPVLFVSAGLGTWTLFRRPAAELPDADPIAPSPP